MLSIFSAVGSFIVELFFAVMILFCVLFVIGAILAIFGGIVYVAYFFYAIARQDRIKEEKLLKALKKN